MPTKSIVEEYESAHPKSKEAHKRAVKVFAADGATHFARIFNPYRPYITHAQGSKKWDVDGNEYIDYVMGHGALLLGHSHPAVVKAVQEQSAKGFHYGDNHELEIEWAELIQDMMPSAERVEFFSCGQEANLMAIRLARVFTGRKKILRFLENYHGWADELVFPADSPGVYMDNIKIIPYDLDKVEEELSRGEYAILMIEGGGAHMCGQIPVDLEFVQALPGLAGKYGTVWHIDEVVTGFREEPGGFQTRVGVRPDLTSLGKIVSGGMGAGALVGRADIMDAFSPKRPKNKRVIHGGTWNSNPLTCAAGIATLRLCQNGQPQEKARELASYFRKKGNSVLKERNVGGWLYGRSITHVYFGPFDFKPQDDTRPPTNNMDKIMGKSDTKPRLALHLLQRGISTNLGRFFIFSCVHTEEDIDKTVHALAESLDAMVAEGTLKRDHK
jgi:glutamate-1-semialdehyde 2,1-aminomutase